MESSESVASMKRAYTRVLLSKDQLAGIGMVIAEWAAVEVAIRSALYELAFDRPITNTDLRPFVVVNGMDARTMLGLLKTLVALRFPADSQAFNKLVDRLLAQAQRRHLVAHSFWGPGSERGKLLSLQMKTVGKLRWDMEEFSAEDFEALADTISAAGFAFTEFFRKRGILQRPSPETPPSPAPA